MAAAATATRQRPALKSPLAAPQGPRIADTAHSEHIRERDLTPRARQIADLADHLRSITNRWGRPFEESTISTYTYPARSLDAWMTAQEIDGDFTAADTAMLNRYFRGY